MTSSNKIRKRPRWGISLFEVLIAILVATVGVFGVMVLIPFAVKNAQRGMDAEAGITAAQNFNADFQAYGYHNPATWYGYQPSPFPPRLPSIDPPSIGRNLVAGRPYLIDPIALGELYPLAGAPSDFLQFPLSGRPLVGPQFPAEVLLDRITVMNPRTMPAPPSPAFWPLDTAFARRLCMPPDVLSFEKPPSELDPPSAKYLELGTSPALVPTAKREYDGRYTTAAVVVPLNDDMNLYKMYTIVIGSGDRDMERVFRLNQTPAPDQVPLGTREYEGIALGGGDLSMIELTTTTPRDDEIRNDDWIMLVSYIDIPGSSFQDVQLNFYRVVHAVKDAGIFHATVQGPDFDVFRDWTPLGGTSAFETYAVLIPNVLTVYERTIRTESNSDWITP